MFSSRLENHQKSSACRGRQTGQVCRQAVHPRVCQRRPASRSHGRNGKKDRLGCVAIVDRRKSQSSPLSLKDKYKYDYERASFLKETLAKQKLLHTGHQANHRDITMNQVSGSARCAQIQSAELMATVHIARTKKLV